MGFLIIFFYSTPLFSVGKECVCVRERERERREGGER